MILEFDVENLEDLDSFDAMEVYYDYGVTNFRVNVVSTRELFHPVFTTKWSGDVDGFEGVGLMSKEREGRFFGTIEELEKDILRYHARLDDNILLSCVKPHQRMHFDDGRISWHLIEKYQDVWDVSGLEFTQVVFDLSLHKLLGQQGDHKEFKDVVFYIMTRVRGRR